MTPKEAVEVIIVCLFVVAVMPVVEGLLVWLSLRDEGWETKEKDE